MDTDAAREALWRERACIGMRSTCRTHVGRSEAPRRYLHRNAIGSNSDRGKERTWIARSRFLGNFRCRMCRVRISRLTAAINVNGALRMIGSQKFIHVNWPRAYNSHL